MLMRKGIDIFFSCSALMYMKSVIINCMTNIAFIPQFKINFISYLKSLFNCLFISSPDPKVQIRFKYTNGAASSSVHTVKVV